MRPKASSYRLRDDLLALIDELRVAMPDEATGQPRSASDVIRIAVRQLAKKILKKKRAGS